MIYLIHFDQPYKHARHYLGFTSRPDPTVRLGEHHDGRGARLLQVVRQAGISFRVVRIWKGGTRRQERRLKAHSSTVLCPVCNPKNYKTRGLKEKTAC